MVFIGVLLMGAAVGFTIDVFVQNAADVDVDLLGRTFVVNPGWLVVAGILALVAFLVGARLAFGGIARARRRRGALRAARRATDERDELAQQLAVERADRERAKPDATSPADGSARPGEVTADQTRPASASTTTSALDSN